MACLLRSRYGLSSATTESNEIEFHYAMLLRMLRFDNLLKMPSSRYWIERSFQGRIHGEKLEFMALSYGIDNAYDTDFTVITHKIQQMYKILLLGAYGYWSTIIH